MNPTLFGFTKFDFCLDAWWLDVVAWLFGGFSQDQPGNPVVGCGLTGIPCDRKSAPTPFCMALGDDSFDREKTLLGHLFWYSPFQTVCWTFFIHSHLRCTAYRLQLLVGRSVAKVYEALNELKPR